ncbi:MAG: outer membrane beta-barrel protein [bacterium]
MRIFKLLICVLSLILLLSYAPQPVAAERFCDVYLGGSLSAGNEDFKISTSNEKVTEEVTFSNSLTAGYRIGYWSGRYPWTGAALELSWFQRSIDGGEGDLDIIPISALFMFRLPLLKSRAYPRGKLLPYAGIGPGIFFSNIEYRVEKSAIPGLVGEPAVSGTYADRTIDIGLDARIGMAKVLSRTSAVFMEYRYTHVNLNFDENVLGVKVNMETELKTHHILIGFSYFF